MRLLKKLERKLGRFAIPQVTVAIIICQILAYGLAMAKPEFLEALQLTPRRVLEGEVWRLFSFLATPPTNHPILAFFFWALFLMMGTFLEQVWGTFRYNVFLLVGYVATVAASFVALDTPATNAFLEGSVFLAFAFINPEYRFYVFFLFPIRVKTLALLTWISYLVVIVIGDWQMRALAIASVANFFLFFGRDLMYRIKHRGRKAAISVARRVVKDQPRHRCVVCGITDRTHPGTDFRYCSKCEGTHGYCPEHLYNHEHIVKEKPTEAKAG